MRFEIGGKSSEIFTVEQKQRHIKRYAGKKRGKTVSIEKTKRNSTKNEKVQEKKKSSVTRI